MTLRELAERYGVTERSVYLHARNEAWEGPRRWSLRRGGEAQTELARTARQLYWAATAAVDRMDLDEAGVKELKELAGLMQALISLERAMEPPKAEKKEKGTVRVVLSDEAEELSR